MSLTALINIPELALLLARYLSNREYCRLSLTCKTFEPVFRPLIWREYEYFYDNPPNPLLDKNLAHLRNLSVVLGIPRNYNDPDCPVIYDLLIGPAAQHRTPQPEREEETGALDSNSSHVIDNHSENKPCRTLQHFKFQLHFEEYEWNKHYDFQVEVQCFLLDVFRYNTCLTEVSLDSQLVRIRGFNDQLLEAFLSLTRLRSLTITMDEVFKSTQPGALKMAMELGHRHPSLESIHFEGWRGGERPCIALRPGHMTEEDEQTLDDREKKHDRREGNFLEETESRLRKSPEEGGLVFPRIRCLELPPRRYYPYPESFVKALKREGVIPNLRALYVPKPTFWGYHQ
ncbi:hypothetical protein EMPS_06928 [Entomortierella parvispora]|uniref:F-box domain-containing protein n=1 Tax=Entomortierella parvispora TaxID=205924 RepID=A0A9P3HDJ8_9FUNG|nr:hypothetical protein EMPS_06928 [Entomortierella parvispora]